MNDLYEGREQSGTKHQLVEAYLEKLAYKILVSKRSAALTYVDAFSGPWNSASDKFSDTSFARALNTLKLVQKNATGAIGFRPAIKGIFVEKHARSFEQLQAFVDEHNAPDQGIILVALGGDFENHVEQIDTLSAGSFRLTFIDPTGWTGYSFNKISPLLRGRNSETIINFMYDHVNRFIRDDRTSVQDSFRPILGEGIDEWLALQTDREAAIISRFCKNLRAASDYRHVVSTPISKSRSDRTHFILAFGTNSIHGLIEFRNAERSAQHHYAAIKAKLLEEKIDQGQIRLFDTATPNAEHKMKQELERLKTAARNHVLEVCLAKRPEAPFERVAAELLERFPLRLTEIKRLCADLASQGLIEASWKKRGSKKRVPDFSDVIRIIS